MYISIDILNHDNVSRDMKEDLDPGGNGNIDTITRIIVEIRLYMKFSQCRRFLLKLE